MAERRMYGDGGRCGGKGCACGKSCNGGKARIGAFGGPALAEGVEMGLARAKAWAWGYSRGIDGILVTVGLCIIALLLCVVMKDKMALLLENVIQSMNNKATAILQGP